MPVNLLPALTFDQANAEHPSYKERVPIWHNIDLLTSSGHRLQKEAYKLIPQLPGEEPELYQNRISKVTSRNLLGNCIKDQVTRLVNGTINVSHLDSDAQFWSDFRGQTDGKRRPEKELVSDLFTTLLKFKVAYLQVDKPRALVAPRNRQEELMLVGNPYILLHRPQVVIDWEEEDDTLLWVKMRQLSVYHPDPFSDPEYIATWTIIDDAVIAKYSAAVELGKDGQITGLKPSNPPTSLSAEGKATIPLSAEPVAHGLGRVPVVRVELKDEMWVGDLAYLKALEHLRTDSSKANVLSYAYIQRYYSEVPVPDSHLPTEQVAATYVGDKEAIKTGLGYVLKADQFVFAEPKGEIVDRINTTLKQIETEVEQLVSLGGANAEPGRVQQESGYAKEFDYLKQQWALQEYGGVIVRALEDTYQMVNRFRGGNPEDVQLSGLDSFGIDSLDDMLNNLQRLSLVLGTMSTLQSNLPLLVFNMLYEKLVMLLIPSAPPEIINQVKDQLTTVTFTQPEATAESSTEE